MRDDGVMVSLGRLESLVREGLRLSGAGLADYEEYRTDLRGAVEDYLHALCNEQKRHHPNGIPEAKMGSAAGRSAY